MTKNKAGFLQVGIALLVASALLAGFLINKVSFPVSEAAIPGTCSCKLANGTNAGNGRCEGTHCNCDPNFEKSNACGQSNPKGNGAGDYDSSGNCVNRCIGKNFSYDFCLPSGSTKTCNDEALARGYTISSGFGGGSGDGGFRCEVGKGKDYPYVVGSPCVIGNSVEDIGQRKPPSCFCGTIQIDGGDYDGTYTSTCGCGGNHPNPTPTPTPVKTPTPTPTKSPSPTPSRSPSPKPTPSRSPSPKPSHSPSPTPICTPTPTPKPTKSPMPSKSPSPSPSATPLSQCNSYCVTSSQCQTGFTCSWGKCRNPSCTKNSNCICQSPTPSPSPTPTRSPSPSPTPVANSKLRICKYDDRNGNGVIDNNEETISWIYNYEVQDKSYQAGSRWWDILNRGCRTVDVPSNQWVKVWEENRTDWSLTNIYSDGNIVGGSDFSYVTYPNTLKTVWFLNHHRVNETPGPSSTPSPAPTGNPNSCNGTCGSNYNCASGLFCYQGYCRNPSCQSESSCGCPGASPTPVAPQVLAATAPPVLPKTGANPIALATGLLGLAGTGFWLFRRFKLV